ncbi:Ger(x)C family spore germination protein [Cohnella nanjingensis]|uniref:Ger(X)C family spore germination protein n=1 Tax=Cohnella nanjingensis TaxID=1387779 RepID=A0A7X0VGA9_9BACL|nr:Ger(x)C family spore germination protein [Cohnella nanjingensis]MBB6672940.1 Ger(x)C family spore germination protein [Cohnella nanjingensis]
MHTWKRPYSRLGLRLLKGFSLLFLLLVMSGCWGQKNIDQLTVVAAIGLDAAPDDRIEMSVQLVNPTLPVAAGAGGQRRPFAMYAAEGDTIFEAMEQIRKQAKKNLFFPQSRIILIEEELARRGIEEYTDFFWRDTQQNPLSWILISKQPARDTLQKSKELEDVPSEEWSDFIKNRRGNSSVTLELYKFLPRLDQVGFQAYAAGIAPVSKGGEETMAIREIAVFKQHKLVGWLTDRQAQVLGWLQGKSHNGMIQFELQDRGPKPVVFELKQIKVRLVPSVYRNRVAYRVGIRAKAELKSSVKSLDLTDVQTNRLLEKKLAAQIRESVEQTIERVCRTYNSDVIGFGEALHQSYPRQWKRMKKRWNEELADLDVQVSVSVPIIKTGLKSDQRGLQPE